jgi:hypothetical protein
MKREGSKNKVIDWNELDDSLKLISDRIKDNEHDREIAQKKENKEEKERERRNVKSLSDTNKNKKMEEEEEKMMIMKV